MNKEMKMALKYIKPCPFCGGTNLSASRTPMCCTTGRVYYFAHCLDCRACGKHVAEEIRGIHDGNCEATINAWNNRSEEGKMSKAVNNE